MILDPVTGPLSREEFAELVIAPYGEATKEADKLADELTDASFDWQDSGGGFNIVCVELES